MAWEDVKAICRLLGHAGRRRLVHAVKSFEAGPFSRWRWPGGLPERLVIAPQDIRTSDPTIAGDIYAGVFAFAGKVAETGGHSPFDIEPPSDDWARELHSFGWLRHLKAANGALTRSNARALVSDWIMHEARHDPIAFETEVAARRLIVFVSQSPLILEGADRAFYRTFLKCIIRHVRRLRRGLKHVEEGYPTLASLISVTLAALSLDGQTKLVRQMMTALDAELLRQILPDGGHVSRNPQVIVDLLIDLLPLRQAFTARGVAPSAALLGAIDRMLPMLRFFRHRNGEFARFNGMGTTRVDIMAAVLAHDDARGQPVSNASPSGYQRLDCGATTLIVDVGAPPPMELSGNAHAGCLAFEMSAGACRFVVNCGGAEGPALWQEASRATAAHSTLTVENTSSARFARSGLMRRIFGTAIIAGPKVLESERLERHNDVAVTASHDGYLKRFGVIHSRSLTLSADGTRIIGVDRLDAKRHLKAPVKFIIRFHLHPSIRASRTGGGQVIMLAPDGEAWSFACTDLEPMLEESIYLSAIHGRRRCLQIVLEGEAGEDMPEITWSMEREAVGKGARRGRA
ncbi:Heparinase II/III-like protein [Hartmannibacter diazotrophicus]|uniref:Heparinase II/III-like protein n=2 Tax=Hartmannibacter diazotrophicus TaxID=1482074 RepID=A0A2C9D0P9_9HYPH|nr:Heparinase II/III-like protein [Hartmannibacter diazotrophicus]